jgi:hypothetical protein
MAVVQRILRIKYGCCRNRRGKENAMAFIDSQAGLLLSRYRYVTNVHPGHAATSSTMSCRGACEGMSLIQEKEVLSEELCIFVFKLL